MRYLEPTNDYAFKCIFGNENKKEILIDFLNYILRLEKEKAIIDVTLLNPYQAPQIKGLKDSIVDVRCKDQSGTEYLVEMQILSQNFFDKRVCYYASKSYSSQVKKGDDYPELRPVVFLGILWFEFTENDNYISTHLVFDVETREHALKDFQFTFVELPKFNKKEHELVTNTDKWIYFLKEAGNLRSIPEVLQGDPQIEAAFHIIEKINWNKDQLEHYDSSYIAAQDQIQAIAHHKEKGKKEGLVEGKAIGLVEGEAIGVAKGLAEGEAIGVAKGLAEGEAIGVAKGLAEGEAKGRAEGELQKAKLIAEELILDGMDLKKVSKMSGLGIEIVEELASKIPVL